MGAGGFKPKNQFVTRTLSQALWDGGVLSDRYLVIDCWDATQVWGRVKEGVGSGFTGSFIPEISADGVNWTKVDIWELETRRIFSTSSGGKVFNFTDLIGAAYARIRFTSMGPSGPGSNPDNLILLELRTLHAGTQTGRDVSEPEVAISAYGAVTDPGALATIAQIVDPGEGIYSVRVVAYLTGTAGAADAANIELVIPGISPNIRLPLVPVANVICTQEYRYLETNSASADITVRAVNSRAGAGVTYHVHLDAQRLI